MRGCIDFVSSRLGFQSCCNRSETGGCVVSQINPQDAPAAAFQSLIIAFSLCLNQCAKGISLFRHIQVIDDLIRKLNKQACIRSPFVQLPGRT
jgi:hypothetical protein